MSSGSQKTQVLNLPLDGSVDQRTHRRQVQAPQVLSATNVRYPDLGSAEKRPGMSLVSGTFVDESGAAHVMRQGQGRLMTCGDELLVTDGIEIGTLVTLPGAGDSFMSKGRVPEAISRRRDTDASPYDISQPDIAVDSNGTEFHVWCYGDGTSAMYAAPQHTLRWTVRDRDDHGEIISQGIPSGGATFVWQPHVVAAGVNVILYYTPSGSNTIMFRIWTGVTWGAETTLVNDGNTSGMGTHYRVCSDGVNFYLVYSRAANIRILKIDPTNGSIVSSVVSTEVYGGRVPFGFGICATQGETVWVTYSLVGTAIPLPGTIAVRASGYSTAMSQTVAPFTVMTTTAAQDLASTGVVRRNASTAVVLISAFGATAADGRDNTMNAPVISSAGTVLVSATRRRAWWAIPASTPFAQDVSGELRIMAWAWVGGARLGPLPPVPGDQLLQWTMMLVDLRGDDASTLDMVFRPITWQSPRYSMPGDPNGVNKAIAGPSFYQPSSCVLAPNGSWYTNGLIRRNNVSRTSLSTYEADFDSPDKFITATLGRTMLMTPGWYWDRQRMAEVSFAHFPQKMEAVAGAAGGFLKNSTLYAYKVIYEYIDGVGNVHRSAPSDTLFVTTPAGAGTAASVSLTVPALNITARLGDGTIANGAVLIRAVVYRTGPLPGPDEQFYRIQAKPQEMTSLSGVLVIGDSAADFDYSDVTKMMQRDILYTAGNVLPNVMPPGFTSVATYHNRAWVTYGNGASFSKAFVAGETVNFTDGFEIPFEEVDALTSVSAMDDTIYFSAADRIYALQGDGPTDVNTLSDFRTPSRVATDKGIIDQRSIVVTPNGMMYQSSVGIQLMSRGMQVGAEPIGSRIQDDLALYGEVTSAIVHPTGGYVTFCSRGPAVGANYDGVRLVYDYTTDRWSRDVVLRTGASVGEGLLGEVVRRGKVYALTTNGTSLRVFQETPGSYLDNGQWVTQEIVMSEVHPQGLQGHFGAKKWQLNAERYTDHNLTLDWYMNYELTPFDSNVITGDRIAAAPIEQFSEETNFQSCQSMRVVIRDATPTGPGTSVGTGRGASFVGIAVEIDPIDGSIWKLAAQEKS